MSYNNRIKPGVGTSVTPNPRGIAEFFRNEIQRLKPTATPMVTLTQLMRKGGKPTNHKVNSILYDTFDHLDRATVLEFGTGAQARFARISVAQISRPETSDTMFYEPQDEVAFITPSGVQTATVIVTPTQKMDIEAGTNVTTALINNGGATFTKPGELIVRNNNPVPFVPFETVSMYYMGRTISESQKIGNRSRIRDVYYDYNYVQHKETTIAVNEDQLNLVKYKPGHFTWQDQQREELEEFKTAVDLQFYFGERGMDFDKTGRPTRRMDGLFSHINTNVSVYNPFDANLNYERFIRDFMLNQAFRYNPNGNTKVMMCGRAFLDNFAWHFRDMRQINNAQNDVQLKLGLDVQTYSMQGFTLKVMPNDLFRLGTSMEHWAVVLDLSEALYHPVKEWATRTYQMPDERETKVMYEWQGTIAWNREESYAWLTTPNMNS